MKIWISVVGFFGGGGGASCLGFFSELQCLLWHTFAVQHNDSGENSLYQTS